MVTSHQKYLCYTRIIQSNETTWILGACRVVKSTFEIIVHFLKEKVRIQNLSFLRSILQCKQILTVHKARVMFYASEKVEQSSLNGLNSFRTCLIALVEYAMVSAFFHFLFKLAWIHIINRWRLGNICSFQRTYSTETSKALRSILSIYAEHIHCRIRDFFDQALQTDVDKEFIKMIDKYNQGLDAKFALLTYKLSYVIFCQASYRSLNNPSILLQQRHMMKLTIRKLKGYGCSVYWKCCKRSKMPIFFETLTINFYYRTGTV